MAESGTWQEFSYIWKERGAFVELCVIWWMKHTLEKDEVGWWETARELPNRRR